MMHKKKTSLVPLMDDRDDLVSNELVLDTELSGFDSQDGGRTATSPTYLTRRYQKNAILTVSSPSWAEVGSMSREASGTCGSERGGVVDSYVQPIRDSAVYMDDLGPVRSQTSSESLKGLTLSVDGRVGAITLTNESLYIQYKSRHSDACRCFGNGGHEDIPFDEIFGTELNGVTKSRWQGYPFSENMYELCLYTLKKSTRNSSVWFPRRVIFKSSAEKVIEKVHMVVQDALQRYTCRPKNLLVFVNPYGGSKRAMSVYEHNVLPILEKAHIRYSMHMTQYRGHAKQLMEGLTEKELEELDGIVAVGGDGLFHELVNALLGMYSDTRFTSRHIEKIKLGHIPAGSTDAVACTLYGTRSACTAAMHIALGDCTPLDVLRIDSGGGETRYAVSMASYGYMGDLMAASETLRWMGPVRYDIVGAKMLALNKSYSTTIEYLPAPEMHPELSSRVCSRHCLVCSQPSHGRLNTAHESFRCHAKGSLSRFPHEWKKIQGEYAAIMMVIMPCRSDKSSQGVAKYGHLNDGIIHLVLVKKCSRWQFLRFLLKISSRGLESGDVHEDYIDVLHVVAAKITHSQDPRESSVWNIDGELLKCTDIVAECHRGAIQVFSRGIDIDPST